MSLVGAEYSTVRSIFSTMYVVRVYLVPTYLVEKSAVYRAPYTKYLVSLFLQ